MRKEEVRRRRGLRVSGLAKAGEEFVVRCIVFAMGGAGRVCWVLAMWVDDCRGRGDADLCAAF